MTEPLLLGATRIRTFEGIRALTAATAFFFRRGDRLYLVTSRHVLHDPPSTHFPDRAEIELHLDARDLTRTASFSIPLYLEGRAVWRQGRDSVGDIDVAVVELDQKALPRDAVYAAFEPRHLQDFDTEVPVGTPLLLVGFPLGFYDTLHHLPVARQAIVASSFGIRFQGQGYFLTDARMHRGASGAPVVTRDERLGCDLPWRLLGVHASRVDMGTRDQSLDETLGLNCAWYADILMTLTDETPAAPVPSVSPAASPAPRR